VTILGKKVAKTGSKAREMIRKRSKKGREMIAKRIKKVI